MIFDTWGGILDTDQYLDMSLRYMERILEHLAASVPDTPVILFTKGGGEWLENMAETGCQAIGIDWTVNIGEARKRVGDRVALQGNLNPGSLRLSDTEIEKQTADILASFGHGNGHVFNLGHGITPDIDPAKVTVLVDAVRELSRQYH